MSGYATSLWPGGIWLCSSGDADDRAARKAGDRVEPGTHAGDVTGRAGQRAAATVCLVARCASQLDRTRGTAGEPEVRGAEINGLVDAGDGGIG
jgi:hypothetical protein